MPGFLLDLIHLVFTSEKSSIQRDTGREENCFDTCPADYSPAFDGDRYLYLVSSDRCPRCIRWRQLNVDVVLLSLFTAILPFGSSFSPASYQKLCLNLIKDTFTL